MGANRGALRQGLVGGQLGARCGQGGAGLRQAGLGGLQGGFGVQAAVSADAAGLCQLLATGDGALRTGQFGLGAHDVGVAQIDVGSQRIVLHVVGADLAHHLREFRLSLLQGHVGVGRVQAHQRLAGNDGFGIVGFDGDDRAGHLGRDLHQVAVHMP
ncbi:hypothetical protein G6F32_015511 [Rhizopus arrhizus]|nr:hypothetical protein G6F32_015511 [Rhizopus arrhizus]